MNIPAKYGNVAKVYVSRENLTVDNLVNIQGTKESIQQVLDFLNTSLNLLQTYLSNPVESNIDASLDLINMLSGPQGTSNNVNNLLNEIPDTILDNPSNLGSININILAYNKNKQLVGNPVAESLGTVDSIPFVLKNNIKQYLNNFRILTDFINIIDGFIINFGVFFDVVSHKYADKNQVKLLCIQKIKDYFKVEKMQFSQPIFTPI